MGSIISWLWDYKDVAISAVEINTFCSLWIPRNSCFDKTFFFLMYLYPSFHFACIVHLNVIFSVITFKAPVRHTLTVLSHQLPSLHCCFILNRVPRIRWEWQNKTWLLHDVGHTTNWFVLFQIRGKNSASFFISEQKKWDEPHVLVSYLNKINKNELKPFYSHWPVQC